MSERKPGDGDARRAIPSVDELLRRPSLAAAWAALGPEASRRLLADELAALRRDPQPEALQELEPRLLSAAAARARPSLRAVVNATGVLLHTNLGRAPLGARAAARVAEAAARYTNLEYDLERGQRARRDRHLVARLAELAGAEAALVVNNNAAAVLLALTELAVDRQGEVLISRGELVEIGESFRIPDVVARGGARLIEVGATNRTRVADYERAMTPATRLILRVHRSNFVMSGFVEQPPLAELAELARRHGLPLVEDLGSGCLLRYPGVEGEPVVSESIAAGVDLVTFSGDKLFGGPQAGMVCGRADLVARLRGNALYRALRVDRLTVAALEATLEATARRAWDELPVPRMAAAEGLEGRTRAFASLLPTDMGAEVAASEAVFGGGSRPGQVLSSWQIVLPEWMAEPLRHGAPPVVARIEDGRCRLDLRTVLPDEEAALLSALKAVWLSR